MTSVGKTRTRWILGSYGLSLGHLGRLTVGGKLKAPRIMAPVCQNTSKHNSDHENVPFRAVTPCDASTCPGCHQVVRRRGCTFHVCLHSHRVNISHPLSQLKSLKDKRRREKINDANLLFTAGPACNFRQKTSFQCIKKIRKNSLSNKLFRHDKLLFFSS